MNVLTRVRKATVVCAVALAVGAAGQVPASAAESDVSAAGYPVVSIEQYCGNSGTIQDPTRSYRLYRMVLTETGRNRHYYDAYDLEQYFKSTGNYCP